MFGTKDVGGLRRFCSAKAARYTTKVADFIKAQETDVKYQQEHGITIFGNQSSWLAWHAVDLLAMSVAASEAVALLEHIKEIDDAAEVPEMIKREALNNILSDMRINSRSSSASSNMAEDAKRAFWIEVGSIVLK
jgi:hypothetical protein